MTQSHWLSQELWRYKELKKGTDSFVHAFSRAGQGSGGSVSGKDSNRSPSMMHAAPLFIENNLKLHFHPPSSTCFRSERTKDLWSIALEERDRNEKEKMKRKQ